MKKLAILLVLILWCQPLMAANRCYDTTQSEDKVIAWMANRDSVTAQFAFNKIVQSGIVQVKDESNRAAENPLINAARTCLNNGQTFTILLDITTELPVGVCE